MRGLNSTKMSGCRILVWGVLGLLLARHSVAELLMDGVEDLGGLDYHQPDSDNAIGDNNTLDSSTDLLIPNVTEAPPAPRIPFSLSNVNASYKSKDDFNPRGMEHLYLITNTFLQIVHRDEEMPQELSKLYNVIFEYDFGVGGKYI